MSAADERGRAMAMAPIDFEKALLLAERITEAWYRCQALAAVSRFAPDPHVERVASKALAAASSCTDGYKRIAASAWPVRALAGILPDSPQLEGREYAAGCLPNRSC